MTQNPHIAVVDDEASTREMVGEYLGTHGFQVSQCDGGASLRELLEKTSPDLIVLDLNMPEEDGLSIVRDLKHGTLTGGVALWAHRTTEAYFRNLVVTAH